MTGLITLAFLGDLMIGGDIDRGLGARGPEHYWGDALPVLRAADAVIANLECPITSYPHRWPWPKTWKFRASPGTVEILEAGNVRFVNLANNHMLDYRAQGLLDTLGHLDAAGIGHAGAGADAEAAAEPGLLRLDGLTVGVIGLTDNKRPFAARPDRPGTNYVAINPWDRWAGGAGSPEAAAAAVARGVAKLRARGAGLVVLSAHLGINMLQRPSQRFVRFVRAAIDAGVDLHHGHSAHLVQAVEPYRQGLALYDTGNFIDDYWKFPLLPSTWSFVFLVEIETSAGPPRLRRLLLRPIEVRPRTVALARGAAFEAICRRMTRLSAARGCTLRPHPEGLELPLGEAA